MANSSFAADVGALLHTRGVGVSNVSIFVGWLPASPDCCVALEDQNSAPSAYGMGPSGSPPAMEYMNVVVRVRHSTYAGAWAKAREVHGVLRNFQGTANGTEYALIRERYGATFLGRDENNRSVISLNYVGTRRP